MTTAFWLVYVLYGISPTPRIEYKFSPEHKDQVSGNRYVHILFGTSAKNQHKQFKTFLEGDPPKLGSQTIIKMDELSVSSCLDTWQSLCCWENDNEIQGKAQGQEEDRSQG